MITLILLMSKLRGREVKSFAQDHAGNNGRAENSSLLASSSKFLFTLALPFTHFLYAVTNLKLCY